jgi:hypothetical protein
MNNDSQVENSQSCNGAHIITIMDHGNGVSRYILFLPVMSETAEDHSGTERTKFPLFLLRQLPLGNFLTLVIGLQQY